MPLPSTVTRRRLLSWVINGVLAAIASILGVILGRSVASPSFFQRRETWVPAGTLAGLEEGVPTPVVVRVTRQDGYYQAVDRQVVFLIKTGEAAIQALSSTCTHLGCRVSWDPHDEALKCPCHGGAFSATGAVVAGPPPRALPNLSTRIDGDRVLIRL